MANGNFLKAADFPNFPNFPNFPFQTHPKIVHLFAILWENVDFFSGPLLCEQQIGGVWCQCQTPSTIASQARINLLFPTTTRKWAKKDFAGKTANKEN